MADGDQYLRTIEEIYAAGLPEGSWPDALASFGTLFGSVGATLEVFDKQPLALLDFHVAGLPTAAETEYLAHYAMHNPRAAFAFRNLDQTTLCDHQLIDERTMDRSAYYAKYLTSIDLRYFLSGQIMNTSRTQGVITIQRSRRQGHVARRDVEYMLKLLPHVRRSYDMASRLKRTKAGADSFEDALEWLADGVAILDGDGALLHGNGALHAMVRRGDGIGVVRRQIAFRSAKAQGRFAAAMAAVLKRLDGSEAMATDFRVDRSDDMPAYVVSLRPLVSLRADPSGARVIAFFHDPLSGDASHALQDLFGLTAAEARLADALQGGISPVEYAERSHLSRNTVYTHLRRLKDKTRCKRLPELIRALNSARVAVRRGR